MFLILFCCQDFDTSIERQALVKHEMFKHEIIIAKYSSLFETILISL